MDLTERSQKTAFSSQSCHSFILSQHACHLLLKEGAHMREKLLSLGQHHCRREAMDKMDDLFGQNG